MSVQARRAAAVALLALALAGCVGTLDLAAVDGERKVNAAAKSAAPKKPASPKAESPAPATSPAAKASPGPSPMASVAPASTAPTVPASGTLASPAPAGGATLPMVAVSGETPADCALAAPAAAPAKGLAKHGAYNAQNLPNGWDNLADEASVTAAIKNVAAAAGWGCFQKFYPGATTVFRTKVQAIAPPPAPGGASSPAPSPSPSAASTVGQGPEACERPANANAGTPGNAQHGAYNAQLLPTGWAAVMADEGEVTAAIGKLEGGTEWPCFQKFYPGATTIFKAKK